MQPLPERRSLTWAALDQQVDAVAGGLAGHGLVAGHRVGLVAPNSLEFVVGLPRRAAGRARRRPGGPRARPGRAERDAAALRGRRSSWPPTGWRTSSGPALPLTPAGLAALAAAGERPGHLAPRPRGAGRPGAHRRQHRRAEGGDAQPPGAARARRAHRRPGLRRVRRPRCWPAAALPGCSGSTRCSAAGCGRAAGWWCWTASTGSSTWFTASRSPTCPRLRRLLARIQPDERRATHLTVAHHRRLRRSGAAGGPAGGVRRADPAAGRPGLRPDRGRRRASRPPSAAASSATGTSDGRCRVSRSGSAAARTATSRERSRSAAPTCSPATGRTARAAPARTAGSPPATSATCATASCSWSTGPGS